MFCEYEIIAMVMGELMVPIKYMFYVFLKVELQLCHIWIHDRYLTMTFLSA